MGVYKKVYLQTLQMITCTSCNLIKCMECYKYDITHNSIKIAMLILVILDKCSFVLATVK